MPYNLGKKVGHVAEELGHVARHDTDKEQNNTSSEQHSPQLHPRSAAAPQLRLLQVLLPDSVHL